METERANEQAVYRIGQLAEISGIPAKTIRFYEANGIVPSPDRTESGYRLYRQGDLERLLFIRRAKTLGLSLDAIREIIVIREGGQAPCDHVRLLLDEKLADVQQRLRALHELERELQALRVAADAVDPSTDSDCYCRILEHHSLAR